MIILTSKLLKTSFHILLVSIPLNSTVEDLWYFQLSYIALIFHVPGICMLQFGYILVWIYLSALFGGIFLVGTPDLSA